jgi:hypothetical protein
LLLITVVVEKRHQQFVFDNSKPQSSVIKDLQQFGFAFQAWTVFRAFRLSAMLLAMAFNSVRKFDSPDFTMLFIH